jgi:hypothetical protein
LFLTSEVSHVLFFNFYDPFKYELFKDFGGQTKVGNWSVVEDIILVTFLCMGTTFAFCHCSGIWFKL